MSYTQSVWFLYALLLMYIFWYLLYRYKIDFKWSWLLAIPVLIACLLMGEYLPMMGINYIGDVNIIDRIASTMYPLVAIPSDRRKAAEGAEDIIHLRCECVR